MKRVAIYVRSSKDLHNVSCEAQEEQIRKQVKQNGEEVHRVFCDKALSSTRDVRPEFDEMIALAASKQTPFSKIYCLDTARFGRDQHESQVILWELRRKHGIEVIFINMPQTGTYLDPAFEAIMSAFDYIHSQQSKVKGVASMKQNVLSGYRAGGRPPCGYRLKEIELGKHRDGHTIVKTKLEPDPETATIVREYFERRARCETRMSILHDFYRRGIPSPTGRRQWPVATAKAMEDNVEVYLGHTVFNRHNERVKVRGKLNGYLGGKKWRSREEWVVKENTHEPLISQDVADKIREMKKKRLRETPFGAKRIYALSGLMKCALCGTNYTGDRGIYRCNSTTKPGDKCLNNDISQKKVEQAVFSVVGQQILNFKNIKGFIARVKKRFQSNHSEIPSMEKKLAQIDNQIRRVMKLYRLGTIDEDLIHVELVSLQEQRKAIADNLEKVKSVQGSMEVRDEDIMEVVDNFKEEINHADPKIKKRAVRALFEEIRIFPKQGEPWERLLEIKGACIPLTRLTVASPTGFEPVLPA